jgi:hypothetical protein
MVWRSLDDTISRRFFTRTKAKVQKNEDISLDEACLVICSEGNKKDLVIAFRHQMFLKRSILQKYNKWKDIFLSWKLTYKLE